MRAGSYRLYVELTWSAGDSSTGFPFPWSWGGVATTIPAATVSVPVTVAIPATVRGELQVLQM